VQGVTVGHSTIDTADTHTGVTVVMPGKDNPFLNKYTAASFVQNGFGKTCGLMQLEELGTLETPIALTNTLNVGKVSDALIAYIIKQCEADGEEALSINPIVGECNDSRINRIQKRAVEAQHVEAAIGNCSTMVEQGAIGAGRGTVCFGFKGGIGTASRKIIIADVEYTIGILVQTNYGATADFVVDGQPIGERWLENHCGGSESDQGSIMVVLATDLPVNSRQLKRILRRAGIGIMRTGAYIGHGSGEVMIGFTTKNRKFLLQEPITCEYILKDNLLNDAFLGAAEAVYEAILNSLVAAEPMKGLKGEEYTNLGDVLASYL